MEIEKIESDLWKRWGQDIRLRRNNLDLTQQTLADRCGYPQEVISRIEHGKYVMRPRLQLALAVALDTTVDELFPWPMGITDLAAAKIGQAA